VDRRGLYVIGGLALLAIVLGGGIVLSEYQNRQKWTPALNAAEAQYGLPAGLLVRQAQEESSFSSAVIDGTEASSAGALGILQLEPAYFPSVQAPRPFSDDAVNRQIDDAAREMARLYEHFGSWVNALAAYNWGEGNMDRYTSSGSPPIPAETQKYVADITADVPAANDGDLVV